jgi:hypothetical protein
VLSRARFPPKTTTWRQCRSTTIQLPYPNSFPSIREYSNAFDNDEIDFAVVTGSICPICGNDRCFRQISPYERAIIDIELDEDSAGEILKLQIRIARFLCRKTLRTFSLLPCQLLPYHRYTVASMVLALLLARKAATDEHRGFCFVATRWLPAESAITGWLLTCWLDVIVTGLRRGHAWLAKHHDLRRVSSAKTPEAKLREVHTYCSVIFARGPPTDRDIIAVTGAYGRAKHHFLFGSPSQFRRRTLAQ